MSFNMNKQGKGFEPGWFLANNEDCTRETRQISATGVNADDNGNKIVKMGTVYPSNDKNAVGIVYEDVNVTSGNMPGSVVTKGEIYPSRIPVTISDLAGSALKKKGFTFRDLPEVTRP